MAATDDAGDIRDLVPLQVEGLPVDVVVAMVEGIVRRFPKAAWVTDHPFGDGPLVIRLGDEWIAELDSG